jgi:hypothetical protein
MSRRSRTASITRRAPVLGVAVLLLGALTWPLLFTYSGFFGDWENHLWLMWHQSLSIESGHFPSLFLNSSYSVFYPFYAFYGGTLYATGGVLSLALGGAPVQAYVLIYLLDFAATLGGWYWLARMAGVGRWLAMVPGLVFATSAYYILVAYVQGDWAEFTGISMIPLMVAAGLSVLRADRLRARAGLALAASSILFFGSHNLTIVFGLSTLALIGLAVLICIPDARRLVRSRSVLRVAGVVVPAIMVSAWYLLPAVVYSGRTRVGVNGGSPEELKEAVVLVAFRHLFTFSRASAAPSNVPWAFALSLPVLAIVWVLVGILVLPWDNRNRPWTRLLLICSAMTLAVIVLMTHAGLLLALPSPYSYLEYSYRLETYVLLSLCAAVLAGLVLARGNSRRARVWRWMAIPVCAVSLVGAIQQIRAFPLPSQDRYATLDSYGEIESGNNEEYQDPSLPKIAARNLPALDIPAEAVHDDRVSFTTHVRPGTLVSTNIGAGPYLVHVTGAKPVGIDSETGDMVLQIGYGHGATANGSSAADGSAQPNPQETISISTGRSLPIVLGRLLTLGGLAILLVELLILPACRLLVRWVRVTFRDIAPSGPPQRDAPS